ncbi:aspartate aminotransferase family protein [Sinorhizobium sp. 8-89]|uniref:aspartate aminotransferase family protein n=1 Tax=Sinorhizobium sp. 7-81 TaxID=3049087 RepID=UPI0024C2C14A|nr:aspartate aminotransferase family protein [Sinorhizobium sp. 7-81]MDK1389779.1 aspartate aminotransferase family protein [Sinorhizobium sp. 7-81]
MSSVFHRALNRKLPLITSGEGIYVVDDSGKRYLDASSGGVVVSALGHGNNEVAQAIEEQLRKVPYFHGGVFTNQPMEELAVHLVSRAPTGLKKAFFVSGGSEAVETAVLLARQYAVETGQAKRTRIIARRNSYHGATLHGLAIGANIMRRTPFMDIAPDILHVPTCYAYREKLDDETEEEYGLRVADEFEAAILRVPQDSVLAFVAETVGGNGSGAMPPPKGYFKRVREICNKYGILLICDEVLCGLGRTGDLHACAAEGITPDILSVAKGLGAGFVPIGAVMTTDAIHEAIRNGSGAFRGGFTYSGQAVACAAALKVQQIVERENLISNVRSMGEALRQALISRFSNNSYVGDIRGRGLLQCIELVSDRSSKDAFDSALGVNSRVRDAAMARGLLVVPSGGTVDGRKGDHVVIAPPFIVTHDAVNDIVERLGDAVDKALESL